MKQFRDKELLKNFFGPTASHALMRVQWIFLFCGLAWAILSGLQILIYYVTPEQRSLGVVIMSFLKYIPLLIVPYLTAKQRAANYLADVFELPDPTVADTFMSSLAFGSSFERITIDNGHVLQEEHSSYILQIGGPGALQVNLDNVAVAEKPNGQPTILYSRAAPWMLEGFERLREIGPDGGVSRFAIIDLKDQFMKDLSVSARTKDGIPIEAQDIKIIFSVKRKPMIDESTTNIHSVTEDAVNSIVYKQIVMIDKSNELPPLAGFPWNSTILPLVLDEIEQLIMQSPLNEILANIGQKELDQTHEAQKQITSLKTEITGQHHVPPNAAQVPQFQSRSKITARFYEPEFQRKADALGVQLLWIDIGTWKLPSLLILEKHKEAWNLATENAAKKASIQRKRETVKHKELSRLINDVIFSHFEQTPKLREMSGIKIEGVDMKKLLLERSPEDIARDILRAFRKELLAAQSMLASKKHIYEENKETVTAIQSAIREISYFTENHETTQ
ncbi:MAG: hypothetical protein AB1649_24385 [Chloroflexota bacterium]